MQRHFSEQFNKNEKLKSRDYKVVIKVWLGTDGRVQKFEISGSSGNEETDAAIRSALSQMAPMPELPPANMPQPIRLRMTSRGAG
jgi:protein TonB